MRHRFTYSYTSHPQAKLLPMDTLKIIRQLQADPALKAELRALLLSEEVLALPEKMDRVES